MLLANFLWEHGLSVSKHPILVVVGELDVILLSAARRVAIPFDVPREATLSVRAHWAANRWLLRFKLGFKGFDLYLFHPVFQVDFLEARINVGVFDAVT